MICPLCIYEHGKFLKPCVKCARIAELEAEVENLRSELAAAAAANRHEIQIRPLDEIEAEVIAAAVQKFGRQKAARILGVGKTTIYRKFPLARTQSAARSAA